MDFMTASRFAVSPACCPLLYEPIKASPYSDTGFLGFWSQAKNKTRTRIDVINRYILLSDFILIFYIRVSAMSNRSYFCLNQNLSFFIA